MEAVPWRRVLSLAVAPARLLGDDVACHFRDLVDLPLHHQAFSEVDGAGEQQGHDRQKQGELDAGLAFAVGEQGPHASFAPVPLPVVGIMPWCHRAISQKGSFLKITEAEST
ncbi:hypothetical protein LZK73_08230 [Neorhizobium galegae]|nr:hypothetical protein LZK73_08230 [Neorhizobium galegae]